MGEKKKVITKPTATTAGTPATATASPEKEYKVVELLKSVNEPVPFAGLLIKKKSKYYSFPAVKIKNTWGVEKKLKTVQKALMELSIPNFSLDSKKNRIGIRMIRGTEQFEPDFRTTEVVELKAVPRKPEEKLNIEDLEIGKEFHIDYIEAGERKSAKVKIVGIKDKEVLFEKEGKLFYCKANNFFKEGISKKEVKTTQGKVKTKVYRYIGVNFADEKPKILTLGENIFALKVCVACTNVNAKIVKSKEKADLTFNLYSVADTANRYELPARMIFKVSEAEIAIFMLLEKEVNDKGDISKSFSLYEFFKSNKEKKNEEDEVAKRIESAFDVDV